MRSDEIRFPLRQVTKTLPDLVVLSDLDLSADLQVEVLGEINDEGWAIHGS